MLVASLLQIVCERRTTFAANLFQDTAENAISLINHRHCKNERHFKVHRGVEVETVDCRLNCTSHHGRFIALLFRGNQSKVSPMLK